MTRAMSFPAHLWATLTLGLPLVGSQLGQLVIHVTDTLLLGRYGVADLAGRTLATGVVPYPPGIPLMMPGENAGPSGGALIGYLKALEAFDDRFPGFGHDTHGIEIEDGVYHALVVRQ